MSDTEEVVLTRKPRNTKPELAREKLKQKRERLKKEKENSIIEEAKKRLVAEEEQRKMEEQKKKELAEADPMTLMMRRMEEMMSRFNTPKPDAISEEEVKPKRKSAPRKKKEPEIVYAEEPKPIPKQRKPRRKIQYEEAIESPSNIFVGNPNANIPQEEEQEQEYYQQEQPAGNPLLNALAARRGMTSWY
jgi:hypothetical protein